MTDYDRVLTIDILNGGKIIGIGIATGVYADAGVSEDGKYLTLYMLEHNFPEEACKDSGYFITNYWYDLEKLELVKVKSERPNDYAIYSSETETWSWDAALVLADIRRERAGKLMMCDWTQLTDTSLTDAQKAEAAEYRTKLRDITKDIGNPANVDAVSWPTVPDFLK